MKREPSAWWLPLTDKQRELTGMAIDAVDHTKRPLGWHRQIEQETAQRALEGVRFVKENAEAAPSTKAYMQRIEDVLVTDFRHHFTSGYGVLLGTITERQHALLLLNAQLFLNAERESGADDIELIEEDVAGLRCALLAGRAGDGNPVVP